MNKVCETGPPVYRPYPRRLESPIICRCYYKDGDGDRTTAGGETQTTPSSREVFPGTSWNAFLGTEGTEGTLSMAYVPRWNNFKKASDQIRKKYDKM